MFQPETESKEKRLVNANHVCNVEELRDNGTSFMIWALVIRQTSVSSPPYKTDLNVCKLHNIFFSSICNENIIVLL